MRINPFDSSRFIGYVSHVSPEFTKVHFPGSSLLKRFIHEGENYSGGLVGEYVVIESNNYGFLGKISQVFITEKERPGLSENSFKNNEFQPIGHVELLLAFDHYSPLEVKKGLTAFPQVGSKVFLCSSKFVQTYLKSFGVKEDETKAPLIDLAHLVSKEESKVTVSQQAIFGRHCAIVGTTGGGKSWTVAKLLEGLVKNTSKAIVIDATGEYESLDSNSEEILDVSIGDGSKYFHYSNLTVDDLFYLLKPSDRVQAPKLLEAVRSLKIVQIHDDKELKDSSGNAIPINDGILEKAGNHKRPYEVFYYKHIEEIENNRLNIDITKLSAQITNECIWDTPQDNNPKIYGGRNDNDISHCVSLISRVNEIVNRAEFNNVFGFKDNTAQNCLTKSITNFLESEKYLLRINLGDIGFEYQVREILANSIAKHLLHKARAGAFLENPLVLFVDEAHQFLNKEIKDDYFASRPLDAFDQIAKECRKYGLFLTIATQMPRDIPTGTLSQMGTFITHRLINYYDKEAVANACSSANKNALEYLPILGEGEAVLMGIDFPMPLVIKVKEPLTPPNSETPKF